MDIVSLIIMMEEKRDAMVETLPSPVAEPLKYAIDSHILAYHTDLIKMIKAADNGN